MSAVVPAGGGGGGGVSPVKAPGIIRVVDIVPDDLARGVNAVWSGAEGARGGIVDGDVGAAAVEKTVEVRCGILVIADDLAIVIDACCEGAVDGQGIVEVV